MIEPGYAKSLAVFVFRNHAHFSKLQLGEFFGQEDAFNVQVRRDLKRCWASFRS